MNNSYREKLLPTKASYPFTRWGKSTLPQYTPEACAAFANVFDQLIERLAALGEIASAEKKMDCFRITIEALNAMNEEDSSLIETGEREDLCELCNVIATAAGLNPEDYGDGEGPASEWRDW